MRPIVLLDCDGVMADFVTAALDVVHDLTGERYPTEAVTTWEIFESIGDRALAERCYGAMNAPGFCLERIRPYPGAAEAVGALREVADVFVVTAPFRTAHWIHERTTWLERHLGFAASQVIFARHKHVVRGDVFVDDKPDHVRAWDRGRRGCDGRGFLWDQIYNRDATDLPRLHGWDALLREVSA